MAKIKLKINDYGYSGEGVGKFNGKTCFVPYTILGEIVEAEFVKQSSKFCKCRPTKILTPAATRIDYPCPYFSKCGGCDFQHISYDQELDLKKQLIKKQLAKVGFGGEIVIHKSPNDYFYRNKIKLFCDGNNLSLYQAESKRLVPIDRCLLVKNQINDAIVKVQTFVTAKNLGGKLKNIIIRCQGGKILVLFTLKNKVEIDYSGLQLMLGAKAGIFQAIVDQLPEHMLGIDCLTSNEFGLECAFDVQAFHQVNDEIGEMLYAKVVDLCTGDIVINAYSGAGVLSGILAKNKKRVYGIELGQTEHKNAEKLKQENNLKNLFNIKGDCADYISKLTSASVGTIVVDPPRAGLSEKVADAINHSSVANLLYISCDRATLTRDIARLDRYKLIEVHLFDMFCHTSSTEVLCQLKLKQ